MRNTILGLLASTVLFGPLVSFSGAAAQNSLRWNVRVSPTDGSIMEFLIDTRDLREVTISGVVAQVMLRSSNGSSGVISIPLTTKDRRYLPTETLFKLLANVPQSYSPAARVEGQTLIAEVSSEKADGPWRESVGVTGGLDAWGAGQLGGTLPDQSQGQGDDHSSGVGEQFHGRFRMVHDGWVGLLSLLPGQMNYRASDGKVFPVRASAKDHHITFYIIGLGGQNADGTGGQKFDGYLMTRTRDAIAGTTSWEGTTYGFYAIREKAKDSLMAPNPNIQKP